MQLHGVNWKGEDTVCSEALVCPCVAEAVAVLVARAEGMRSSQPAQEFILTHSSPHSPAWAGVNKTHPFLGRRKLANTGSEWGFPKFIQVCRSKVQYQLLQTDRGFPNLNQVCRDKVQYYSLQTDHVASSLCVNGTLCVYKLHSFLSFLWLFF